MVKTRQNKILKTLKSHRKHPHPDYSLLVSYSPQNKNTSIVSETISETDIQGFQQILQKARKLLAKVEKRVPKVSKGTSTQTMDDIRKEYIKKLTELVEGPNPIQSNMTYGGRSSEMLRAECQTVLYELTDGVFEIPDATWNMSLTEALAQSTGNQKVFQKISSISEYFEWAENIFQHLECPPIPVASMASI
jgi:hypothetical protein